MKKSGVDAVLSASLMQEKFPQFPWPPNVLDIGDWLREKSRKKAELAWETLLVLVLPMRLRLKPRKEFEGKDSEGALLFTSGSSGNPKGVVLSHGNLLANCDQIAGLEDFFKHGQDLGQLAPFSFLWLYGCHDSSLDEPVDYGVRSISTGLKDKFASGPVRSGPSDPGHSHFSEGILEKSKKERISKAFVMLLPERKRLLPDLRKNGNPFAIVPTSRVMV